MIGLWILGVCNALLGIYNLWNNTFCYSQYKAFNDNVKNWSEELDKTTNRTMYQIFNKIEKDIEDKYNNKENKEEENGKEITNEGEEK